MIYWEDFVVRRNISFEEFKTVHGVSNVTQFIECCSSLGLIPPAKSKLDALFPKEKENVVEHPGVKKVDQIPASQKKQKKQGANNQ